MITRCASGPTAPRDHRVIIPVIIYRMIIALFARADPGARP